MTRRKFGSEFKTEAVKLVKAMGDVDAETIRINVANYLAVVAMNTKDPKRAGAVLEMLSYFSNRTYSTSDKLAPLLLSLGMALGL